MKVASFPSLQGHVGNGKAIAHELARAIGQIESYVMRNRKEPAASALLTAFLQYGITTIDNAGKLIRSLAITPTTVTLSLAGTTTQQLVVTATLADSTTSVVTPAASGTVYTSSDPTKATVSAAGLVTAVAVGTTTITATNKGISDTQLVTVTV